MLASASIIACILFCGVSWIYIWDEPEPSSPSWAAPIVRDPAAVAAMEALWAVETQLEHELADEKTRLSEEAREELGIAREPGKLRSEIEAVLSADRDALSDLRALLDSEAMFTFPEVTTLDFGKDLNMERYTAWQYLLRFDMRSSFWNGEGEAGIEAAFDGIRLGNALAEGKGTILHLLLSITSTALAIDTGAIPKFDMAERPSLLRLEYEHPNERRKDS